MENLIKMDDLGVPLFWKHPFLSFLDVTLLKFPILQASTKIGVTSCHVPSISPPPISSLGIYSVISQNLGFPGTPKSGTPHSHKESLEVWESLWGPGVSRLGGSMVQIPLPTVRTEFLLPGATFENWNFYFSAP